MTIESIVRGINRELVPAFEEKLRAALAVREAELAPRLADLARAVEQGREFMHAVEHLRADLTAARGALQTIRDTSAPRIGEIELIPSPPRRAPHGAVPDRGRSARARTRRARAR